MDGASAVEVDACAPEEPPAKRARVNDEPDPADTLPMAHDGAAEEAPGWAHVDTPAAAARARAAEGEGAVGGRSDCAGLIIMSR